MIAVRARRRSRSRKVDPTSTTVLRGRYAADLRARFRRLKGLIWATVVNNDALGLAPGPGRPLAVILSTYALLVDEPRLRISQTRPARRFEFTTSPEKVGAFMDWLRRAVDAEILEVLEYEGRTVVERVEWQNTYVRAAYSKGVEHASAMLREAGYDVPEEQLAWIFNKPQHADALGMLFTRNFEELRGITEVMSQQIARELTEGMAQGWNPRKIGRALNKRVDNIGAYRATLLARTEIIRAHAEATLNRFESFQIPGVTAEVEFSHAKDARVCEICQGLGGSVYTLAQARGIIPVHPQCRCAWLPVPVFGIVEE